MKYIIKIMVLSAVCLFLAGCDKEKNEPDAPAAPKIPTLSLTSVTLEEGESQEVSVSNGVAPYSVSISPLGIAGTAINGSRLIITGIVAGNAIATVHGSDGGKTSISITVTEKAVDIHSAFKADTTLRIELTNGKVIRNIPSANEPSPYIFYRDAGNQLFASPKTKIGYAERDASSFFFIEWTGDASAGTKDSPSVRTENGVEPLSSIEIIQVKDRMIWLIWTSGNASGKLVQKWEAINN
ncbi:MAG: hypothetical protein LBK97_02685 [Prevotellaceae bacterium]|jgi:hypothetical protein|nr:hypothetical protein [Prevotellaceae bacterium]